jgi:hypothetical protein
MTEPLIAYSLSNFREIILPITLAASADGSFSSGDTAKVEGLFRTRLASRPRDQEVFRSVSRRQKSEPVQVPRSRPFRFRWRRPGPGSL